MTENMKLKGVLGLLDDERSALLEANFEKLSLILDEKLSLLASIRSDDFDVGGDEAQELRKQFEKNQELTVAAMSGLKAASEKIDDVIKAFEDLRVYSKRGDFDMPHKKGIETRF